MGGAERVVLDLASQLDQRHIDCRLVSFSSDVGSFSVHGPPAVPHDLIDIKASVWPRPWRAAEYVRLLKEFRPHVVHAHMYHALMLTLAASQMVSKRPAIVFTSHNAYVHPKRARLIRLTRSFRSADIIFAIGQHPNINAERTVVIPNGVEVGMARLRPPDGQLQFLSVGRLVEQKDPFGLLESFAAAAIPNATLSYAGSGPLEMSLRQRTAALGLESQVRVLGLRKDVRALLRGADAFVMHSNHEGLPLAMLEAGAESLPVIATPVGAIPEVLRDKRGYVVPKAEFAATLRHVAARREEARQRGLRLFDHISKNYSIRAMVDKHEQLYHSTMGREVKPTVAPTDERSA